MCCLEVQSTVGMIVSLSPNCMYRLYVYYVIMKQISEWIYFAYWEQAFIFGWNVIGIYFEQYIKYIKFRNGYFWSQHRMLLKCYRSV